MAAVHPVPAGRLRTGTAIQSLRPPAPRRTAPHVQFAYAGLIFGGFVNIH